MNWAIRAVLPRFLVFDLPVSANRKKKLCSKRTRESRSDKRIRYTYEFNTVLTPVVPTLLSVL